MDVGIANMTVIAVENGGQHEEHSNILKSCKPTLLDEVIQTTLDSLYQSKFTSGIEVCS